MTFCSSPDTHWSYPCRTFGRHVENIDALVVERDGSSHEEHYTLSGDMIGDWAACNVCHILIERGDRERLAKRSARRMLRTMRAMPGGPMLNLANATAHIRRLHDQFWSNRMGAPTYHEHRPKGKL